MIDFLDGTIGYGSALCESSSTYIDSSCIGHPLDYIDLDGNDFNDEDVPAFARALETNKTLKYLVLSVNDFTHDVADQFFGTALRTNNTLETLVLLNAPLHVCGPAATICSALFDETSLNSASDSNHNCNIYYCRFQDRNKQDDPVGNWHRKIHKVLASRNNTMSNVKHFDDIDINLVAGNAFGCATLC